MNHRTSFALPYPLLLSLLLLSLLPIPAPAAESFYLELTCGSDDRQAQDAAFREGMRLLLGRFTGERKQWLHPQWSDLVEQAPRYVDRFSYQRVLGNIEAQPRRRTLRVWYAPNRLRQALRDRGFAMGDQEAPTTLVWLLERQGGDSVLLSPDEPGSPYQTMPEVATGQRVKLLQPLVDMEERNRFVPAQGDEAANDSLLQLSRRYEAQAVLIGYLSSQGGGWQADWYQVQGEQRTHWSIQGPSVEALLTNAAERLSGRAAMASAAVPASPPKEIELMVLDAGGGATTAKVRDALSSLSLLESVRPLPSQGRNLRFQAGLLGGVDELKQAIGFGGLLALAKPPQENKPKPKPTGFDPLGDMSSKTWDSSSKKPKPDKPEEPRVLYFTLLP